MGRPIRAIAAVLLAAFACAPASATEFRVLQPIATPGGGLAAAGPVLRPVGRETVEAAAREIFARYNTPDLAAALAGEFFDAERLADAVTRAVPRDARMRVLSVQGAQTLGQAVRGSALVSTVSAVVRAQLEFNDPVRGFQRREGTNELLLRIREPLEP